VTRPKTFDERETLRKIGNLFWERGYVATDLDLVCRTVSLSKPSIYNAYGDKASLFRQVVDWYTEDVLSNGDICLKGEAPVSEEIRDLLRVFMVLPTNKTIVRGCLLATSMMELQHGEPALFRYVRAKYEQVPKLINDYLSRAYASGRLRRDADPVALGGYVFTVLLGLRMQSRTRRDSARLDDLIDTSIGFLRHAESI